MRSADRRSSLVQYSWTSVLLAPLLCMCRQTNHLHRCWCYYLLGDVSSRCLGKFSVDEVRTSLCKVAVCSAICITQENRLYLWGQKIQQIAICLTYRIFRYSIIIIIINVIRQKSAYIVVINKTLIRLMISVSVQRILKQSNQNEMRN